MYDQGATSKTKQANLGDKQIDDGIMRKKPRGKAMPHWQQAGNKLKSSKRFVVERTFATMTRVYGLHRARYLGIAKPC